MAPFTTYALYSAALACLFAFAIRLGAYAIKYRETGDRKYKITFVVVFWHLATSLGLGAMTFHMLVAFDWRTELKTGAVFLISFISTEIVEAMLKIKAKMILREFLKWIVVKIGTDNTQIQDDEETTTE